MHGQQPPDLNALGDLAELDLHTFAVGELDAEPFSSVDVILRDLQAALGPPEPTHAVSQPRRAEPDLGHFQSITDAEQHIFVVDFEAVEFKLAMAAVFLRPHDRDASYDAPARLIAVIKKRGQPAAPIVRGSYDDDEMRRLARAGDEPFTAGDDPFAVFLLRARADHAGIRTAARRRLGHCEGRFHLALDDRAQPPFPLRRRADARQEIHVAVIGRGAVDRQWPE